MKVTQIVFSYPQDAKYLRGDAELVEIFDQEGGDIEDYKVLLAEVAPGDRVVHDGRLWIVAEIQEFTPVDHDHSFQIAIATLDGSTPQRDDWGDSEDHCMYALIAEGKCIRWGMPAKLQHMPRVGSAPHNLPEYKVDKVWEFEAVKHHRQGFAQVYVCECLKVPALELEWDGAIAA